MTIKLKEFSNISDALALYRITEDDIKLVKAYSEEADKHIKSFIDDFYRWIPDVPEYKTLFSRAGLLESVKKKQVVYWKELFNCNLNSDYLKSRSAVGEIHAKIKYQSAPMLRAWIFQRSGGLNKLVLRDQLNQ
jgi:hypothetical protein